MIFFHNDGILQMRMAVVEKLLWVRATQYVKVDRRKRCVNEGLNYVRLRGAGGGREFLTFSYKRAGGGGR